MSEWNTLEHDLGLCVFFCHPHCPWERPSNEHTNRQLRYWLPKGTNLAVHSQPQLDHIANILNTSPRRLLGWHTPQALYDHYRVALTL